MRIHSIKDTERNRALFPVTESEKQVTLEQRIEYLERMTEKNFNDNTLAIENIGRLKFKKPSRFKAWRIHRRNRMRFWHPWKWKIQRWMEQRQ